MSDKSDSDGSAFREALMAAYKRHREPDFANFAAAFSSGWLAHREHEIGKTMALLSKRLEGPEQPGACVTVNLDGFKRELGS